MPYLPEQNVQCEMLITLVPTRSKITHLGHFLRRLYHFHFSLPRNHAYTLHIYRESERREIRDIDKIRNRTKKHRHHLVQKTLLSTYPLYTHK